MIWRLENVSPELCEQWAAEGKIDNVCQFFDLTFSICHSDIEALRTNSDLLIALTRILAESGYFEFSKHRLDKLIQVFSAGQDQCQLESMLCDTDILHLCERALFENLYWNSTNRNRAYFLQEAITTNLKNLNSCASNEHRAKYRDQIQFLANQVNHILGTFGHERIDRALIESISNRQVFNSDFRYLLKLKIDTYAEDFASSDFSVPTDCAVDGDISNPELDFLRQWLEDVPNSVQAAHAFIKFTYRQIVRAVEESNFATGLELCKLVLEQPWEVQYRPTPPTLAVTLAQSHNELSGAVIRKRIEDDEIRFRWFWISRLGLFNCLDLLDELKVCEPGNEWALAVAGVYELIGITAGMINETTEELESILRCLSICRLVLQNDPEDPTSPRYLENFAGDPKFLDIPDYNGDEADPGFATPWNFVITDYAAFRKSIEDLLRSVPEL